MLDELDRFYGALEVPPRGDREMEVRRALFGPAPVARALLAKDDTGLVGLASYSFLWPAAGTSPSLFLKELYVRQDQQRRGIGQRLMQELCAIAVGAGCSRVEWQTDEANQRARAFYKSLGDPVLPGKVCYRLDGEALRRLAG